MRLDQTLKNCQRILRPSLSQCREAQGIHDRCGRRGNSSVPIREFLYSLQPVFDDSCVNSRCDQTQVVRIQIEKGASAVKIANLRI